MPYLVVIGHPRQRAGHGRVNTARRLRLRGHVQGVGFRPFVYRTALQHGVGGTVQNQLGEVEVVATGSVEAVERFSRALVDDAPPLAAPELASAIDIEVPGRDSFEIIDSEAATEAEIFVPPDYFMCDDCRAELADPTDRRHGYPFINCTQCGPRYTLIERLPYDRPNTSMASFPLCADCEAEYRDPLDRRFHAEPVACPACGPHLALERGDAIVATRDAALRATVAAIREGEIVAVKGIGGYHLVCDARNEHAIATLRERKRRPHKPLAVMFPLAGADGLDSVRRYAILDRQESECIAGSVRPIVLVRCGADTDLAANVAPDLAEIGVFLPYSPHCTSCCSTRWAARSSRPRAISVANPC